MSKLIGVLADVHGDLQALDAALPRLRAMGCDVILCAGDLIDMEPLGEECVQRLKAEKNLICILGNHERWAMESRRRQKDVRSFFEPCHISEYFGGGAELSHSSLAWLATLPTHWEAKLEGIRVAMWHARPGSRHGGAEKETTGPELRRRLLEQAHADILIVGHSPRGVRAGSGRPAGEDPESRAHAARRLTSTSMPARSSCPMRSGRRRSAC